MWLVIMLILFGALLLVAEMVLLPGITVAGLGSLAAYGTAIWLAYTRVGSRAGLIVVAVVVVVSVAALIVSMNSRTWRRFSLKQSIDGVSQSSPSDELTKGDRGVAITRLAPLGKVIIGDRTYEARSLADKYVDENSEVEVVGFENFSVLVKKITN